MLPFLDAEVPVWNSDGATLLAGRVDALILHEAMVLGVLDWKSDLKPSPEIKSHYVSQLSEYLAVSGAGAGALVFMTSGEIVWIGDLERLLAQLNAA